MRPSEISRSSARLAISRRIGLWQEITTASGVSSMIRSTPVAASMARMLRPSRPMMRPFMSSLGRCTTETVRSATNSPARRSMAIETIFLARRSASSRASCLDQADVLGGLVARLLDHLFDELLARLVAGQAGGLLELLPHLVDE